MITKIQDLVRENIKALRPYSSARDEFKGGSSEMIFLDANENPFGEGLNRYPDPQQRSLKEILAVQKGVQPSQILLGNGSDEVLDLIFRAFCEPKEDTIITLPPTYGMYSVLAETNNVQRIEISLQPDFQPNVDAILKNQDGTTKLLFLCSPNNPTANSFEATKVAQLLEEFRGIVVIDEAYIDFSEQESWIGRLNEFPNLVVTQTLSKAYGLAGIRLGICYASSEIIAILNRIKPPYNVNQLTQEVALKALQDQEKVQWDVKRIVADRNQLVLDLKDVDFIERIYPSDANFLLVKVDDANKRYAQLIKEGIVVRNRTHQRLCENCLRFTVGNYLENEELTLALMNLE